MLKPKIIFVSLVPSTESLGPDQYKGGPLNLVEFDQVLINLQTSIGRAMPLAGSAGQAFSVGALSATGVFNCLGGSSLGITIRSNGFTTEEYNDLDAINFNYVYACRDDHR